MDSEVYATALVAVLSAYSEAIVARVTDPRTGLPGRSQWLPTIFEVRQACEHEMQPIRDEEARRARRAESERNMTSASDDRKERKTFEDLARAYPDVVGQSKPRVLTVAEKEALYADLGARRDLRAPLEPSDRIRETLAAYRP